MNDVTIFRVVDEESCKNGIILLLGIVNNLFLNNVKSR
jgi:hypothetical protein